MSQCLPPEPLVASSRRLALFFPPEADQSLAGLLALVNCYV